MAGREAHRRARAGPVETGWCAALFIDMKTIERTSRADDRGRRTVVHLVDQSDEVAIAEAHERRVERDCTRLRKIAGRHGIGGIEIVEGRA